MKYLRLTTVVWGLRHTRLFVEGCLPSLLAPGNLPSLRDGISVKYRIYTTFQDAEVIGKSSMYTLLDKNIDTEINVNLLGELLLNHNDKYHTMNLCFADAIKDTNLDDGAWSWIHPDVVYSNGSFSTVAAVARSGKRLMLASCGLRTNRHLMLPNLITNYQLSDGSISVPTKDLVKLSIDYMHPRMKRVFWDSYNRAAFHWGVFWHVNSSGILQRSYALTPILIYPKEKGETPDWNGVSIEATDYLERSVPNKQDIYIVIDTDEFYMCSLEDGPVSTYHNLSEVNSVLPDYVNAPSIFEFALVGKNYIPGLYARNYPRSGIRYHYASNDENDEKEWQKIEKQSEKFVTSVYTMMELFDKHPLFEHVAEMLRRLESRLHGTNRRIKKAVWIRTLVVIELAMVRMILGLFQRKKGQNA